MISLFGGTGFILGRYHQMYPETVVEPRDCLTPTRDDVIYGISTTTNYAPTHGDLHTDIDTNLTHFARVLPNVKGEFNLLSTWFVYGARADARYVPYESAHETDPCDPNGWYSITALAREKLLRSHQQMVNRSHRILRLCNVIGNDPRANKQKNALEMMLQRVKRGEEVEIYTGDCYRSIMHVDDVCRAINLCVNEGPLNEIINIGQPSARIYDLIQHAKHVTKSKSKITLIAPPRFHQMVQTESFKMDTAKLRYLGFVPDTDPYQAVERVLGGIQ